eukprot:CAMPEP_0197699954 /NCGR_PEP_ID=MMETSP1338-20131121/121313_1 /TAXON_ID=43686 ORGANISM="Pelagodinium beii, Strain RCC1491" /NCGR_SAMPLE_ID=MMETSP1338 /ASSEMBLY_ACC=CAM_ASM_000754 /LENGTH=561 /DNA_ID=CAMNT_0043283507 /DNA_START=56 /DNA_END=1741 /DNA_ORIENTATION=-
MSAAGKRDDEAMGDFLKLLAATTPHAIGSAPPGGLPSGMPAGLWAAMCKRQMEEIHKSHGMSKEEKEQGLRSRQLVIPGRPHGRTIEVLEDPSGHYAAGASGAVLWPASTKLIEWLDDEVPASCMNFTRALELGAGLGAAGLFLALHKGCEVVLTETPESLPLLTRNVTENYPDGLSPQVAPLVWGDAEHIHMLGTGTFDLIIGSDVTYRPDCLDALLSTAAQLLAPGGRFLLSLQDRPGEVEHVEYTLQQQVGGSSSSRPWRIESKLERKVEIRADFSNGQGADDEEDARIILLELRLSRAGVANGNVDSNSKAVPGSTEQIEDEFFRLTGIRPEPVVVPKRETPSVPEDKNISKKSSLKERVVEKLIETGMAEYVHEGDTPQTATDLRPGPKSGPKPLTAAVALAATEDDWPSPSAFGEFFKSPRKDAQVEEATEKPEDSTAPPSTAPPSSPSNKGPDGMEARICMDGLEWNLDTEKEQVCATVTFGEELWLKLCGISGSDFKEAVSFELAEKELRVLHVETVVLDVDLPLAVDASRAVASVSSRKRRVAVKAPKLSPA